MSLRDQVVFLLSALGAINGFALSAYFLFILKTRTFSEKLLGGLLFVLSVRIIKSAFKHFNPHLFEVFIQVGLSACALIGPFLYLYTISVTRPKHQLEQRWWHHVLPFVIIMLVLSLTYPYYDGRYQWSWRIVTLIYEQWLLYLVLAAWQMRSVFQRLFQRSERLDDQEVLLLNVYVGTFIIWLAYWTSSYTSYIVGALSFSFILYLSLFLWVFRKRARRTETPTTVVIKYANKQLSEEELVEIQRGLHQLFNQENIYQNPKLKLADLAGYLGTSPHQLSQYLNDNLEKSFSQFVNEHRIAAAKVLLIDQPQFTAEAIGYDCGFNSKSTFFSTFKKLVGCTPAVYRERH
ncbi:MAG: helix-turn-helix domain-containing protein [Bacteroidota bacterium]